MNRSHSTIALTGGIAAGKSAVTRILAEQGVAIIDAVAAAREIVEPGQPALADLVSVFGTDILTSEGDLDRVAVRARERDGSRKALIVIRWIDPWMEWIIGYGLGVSSGEGSPRYLTFLTYA